MSTPLVIRNLTPVLSGETLLPTFTRYNRLESRPRTDNFNRALRAEIRDALWMICKQWQMGEFLADDAGTPVAAKVHIEGQQIAKYKPDDNDTQRFDLETPLEGTVERRPIPFQAGKLSLALDLRLQMGRRWLKMIPPAAADQFKKAYPIMPPDPTKKDDALICAHTEAWQQFQAVAGRAMDGAALYFHLKANPGNLASDGVAGLTTSQKTAAEGVGPRFVEWFEKLYLTPKRGEGDAWLPERL